MESTDREILLEINGRLQRLGVQVMSLEETVASVGRRVNDVVLEQRLISSRVDGLRFSVYCGFTLLCAVIAFVHTRRERRSESPAPTPKDDKEFTFSGKLSDLVEAMKALKRSD